MARKIAELKSEWFGIENFDQVVKSDVALGIQVDLFIIKYAPVSFDDLKQPLIDLYDELVKANKWPKSANGKVYGAQSKKVRTDKVGGAYYRFAQRLRMSFTRDKAAKKPVKAAQIIQLFTKLHEQGDKDGCAEVVSHAAKLGYVVK